MTRFSFSQKWSWFIKLSQLVPMVAYLWTIESFLLRTLFQNLSIRSPPLAKKCRRRKEQVEKQVTWLANRLLNRQSVKALEDSESLGDFESKCLTQITLVLLKLS